MKNLEIHKINYFLLIITTSFLTTNLYSQDYSDKLTEDGVKFEYKWRNEKILVKDSPDALFLKISNTSDQQKLVGFELNYYWKGLRSFGSEYQEYCLKPGQTIRGKRWNLAFPFITSDKKNINDEQFTWEIENLEVTDNTACETGLELRLVPKHETNPCQENDN